VRVINQFFKFDFKFRALLDLRVVKRMRMDLTHDEGDHSACSVRYVMSI